MINIFYVKYKKGPYYKLMYHTADMGIIVEAEDLKDLFKRAALSLIHVIIGSVPE